MQSTYSEACQAFVLRDFDTASGLVDSLLEEIEGGQLQSTKRSSDGVDYDGEEDSSNSKSSTEELARRVYVLYITLAASKDDSLSYDTRRAERELTGIYSRIQRYHDARAQSPSSSTAAAAGTSSGTHSYTDTLVHPSLLVALSLAGLKLNAPTFVQKTLQDYFQKLLQQAEADEKNDDVFLSSSQGDLSGVIDASHADLSLSSIAVNGHHANSSLDVGHGTAFSIGANALNGDSSINNRSEGVNGINGSSNTANSVVAGRTKSLQRLSRIYSINLLGKALGDWPAAKAWIKAMKDDDAAHMAGLMSDAYADTLLDTLDEVKAAHEQEQKEAKQAEKRDKERQADIQKKSKMDTRRAERSSWRNSSAIVNGQSKAAAGPSQGAGSASGSAPSQGTTATSVSAQNQETGFAAFRSHLSSFLATSHSSGDEVHGNDSSRSQSTLDRRRRDHTLSKNDPKTVLDVLRQYSTRLAGSRLLKLLLAFFIITGFWRRRLTRSGRRLEIGETLKKVKDKVVETVKMGGSLGFL